mmetsp:Transcript_29491/g.28641  ORF Transcript_29491/g.28641 Transcript_29491/m.28641 type:complete len:136 (-) Transcript_29491:237-644(-)
MREHWHPSIKIIDIIERSLDFIEKNSAPLEEIKSSLIRVNKKVSSLKLVLALLALKTLLAAAISWIDHTNQEINPEILKQLELSTFLHENAISKWYGPSKVLEYPPLHCYFYKGIGKALTYTTNNITHASVVNSD